MKELKAKKSIDGIFSKTQNNSIRLDEPSLSIKTSNFTTPLNSSLNEIIIKDITKHNTRKSLKGKFQKFLKETKDPDFTYCKDEKKNSKIRKAIDKFTNNLLTDNKQTKNKPIVQFKETNSNNRNYFDKESPIARSINFLINSNGKRSNSVSKLLTQMSKETNKINITKTAKIDLFEEAMKPSNEIDNFSKQFDKTSQQSYLFAQYNKVKGKLYSTVGIKYDNMKKNLNNSFSTVNYKGHFKHLSELSFI